VIVNGDDFEAIELKTDASLSSDASFCGGNGKRDIDNNISEEDTTSTVSVPPPITPSGNLGGGSMMGGGILSDGARDSSGYASESGDMLRELVKNKELLETNRKKNLSKVGSVDSDVSDSSIMVRYRVAQHTHTLGGVRRGCNKREGKEKGWGVYYIFIIVHLSHECLFEVWSS